MFDHAILLCGCDDQRSNGCLFYNFPFRKETRESVCLFQLFRRTTLLKTPGCFYRYIFGCVLLRCDGQPGGALLKRVSCAYTFRLSLDLINILVVSGVCVRLKTPVVCLFFGSVVKDGVATLLRCWKCLVDCLIVSQECKFVGCIYANYDQTTLLGSDNMRWPSTTLLCQKTCLMRMRFLVETKFSINIPVHNGVCTRACRAVQICWDCLVACLFFGSFVKDSNPVTIRNATENVRLSVVSLNCTLVMFWLCIFIVWQRPGDERPITYSLFCITLFVSGSGTQQPITEHCWFSTHLPKQPTERCHASSKNFSWSWKTASWWSSSLDINETEHFH